MLLTIIFLWIILCVGYVIYVRTKNKVRQDKEKVLAEQLVNYDNAFHDKNTYTIGLDYKTKIAYNNERNEFKYYRRIDENKIQTYAFDFNDVIDVEFALNGNTISKMSRSEQIGGALLGGAIAGGTGAIIGSLSTSRIESEKIHKATLKITTNDLEKPVLYVEFLPEAGDNPIRQQGYDKNGEIMQAVIKNLEKWEAIFKIAMNKNTTAS